MGLRRIGSLLKQGLSSAHYFDLYLDEETLPNIWTRYGLYVYRSCNSTKIGVDDHHVGYYFLYVWTAMRQFQILLEPIVYAL